MADTATACPRPMSTTSLTFSSQTGHIFGVVLACFVSLPYCSLSVLAHLALCLLCAVVGVRVYTIAMVKAGKVEAGVYLLACVAIFRPAWISPDLLGRRHVVQLLRPPSAPSAGLVGTRDLEVEAEVRMRYQAASAGPHRPPAARPQSGAFSLDLAAIEGRAGSDQLSDAGPMLVEHDLQGIMDSVPVQLPYSRTGRSDRRMSSGRTPEGEPGSHQLMRSQEAHQAVSSVIAQVYNTDFQVSIAALGQLDKLMKDNDKVELIGPGSTSCSVCAASSTDTCCKPR